MSIPNGLLDESADDLFETAPCGYLTTALDGSILRVNRTFEELTGRKRVELLGTRFQDLLTPGARIYHETHYAPLLRMQGSVREIAVEIVRSDGSNVPAFVNAVVRHDDAGQPRVIRTTVFDATDRRRYEQELLKARRREHEVALELQRGLLAGALRGEGEGIEIGVAYSAACSPGRCRRRPRWSSTSCTARPVAGSRWAATGTTRSGWRKARLSRSWLAT
jgi:PAS domain S-box-containing protein